VKVTDLAEFEKLKPHCTDKALFLLFWAEWHQPSHIIKDMMEAMASSYPNVRFAWCDSDQAEDLVDKFNVDEVPTVAVIHPHKLNADILDNPSPDQFSEQVTTQNEFYEKWFEQEKQKAYRDIEDLISSFPFFIFIKGTKDAPKCKFTRKLMETLLPKEYRF
jgi:thiol-disulfide isomerase/thioredoxin